jgi:isoquinoline 1-oxidoreductase
LSEGLVGFGLARRDFLKGFGAGLLVCLTGAEGWAQESGRGGGFGGGRQMPQDISAWLHIGADGAVTVYTGKVEVGQNIRTSLAQAVAEELRVGFDAIAMVMGDTDLTPYDTGTFGSQTTPQMGPQLRRMAAAARETLIGMAAARWSLDAATLTAADGKVMGAVKGQSVAYGELTRGEKLVKTVSVEAKLTPATEWKIAGTAVPKANGREFVTGKHQYPSDVVRPRMMFGKVLRAGGFNATLVSLDTAEAEKMPGVKVVKDGDFTGVAAEDAWTAERALAAVQAKWNVPAGPSNKEMCEYFKQNPEGGGQGGGRGQRGAGAGAAAVASGAAAPAPAANAAADAVRLEQSYVIQYIAHAPLEPRAAVAEWADGKLTVWTGTQRPFGVRDELAAAFKIPATQVRVIQPDMGAGYGGKHTGETAIEAARLAKAAGRPVKLVWTREEEFTWAYFRPGGLIEIRSAAGRDGTLLEWEHHNYNSGNAAIGTPYKVAGAVTQYHATKSPLRQGSYRGLAATANHFARESHMDELAHAVGMDPLEFRLKNLDNARLVAVFHAAAEKFGWGSVKAGPGRGFGIAGGADKGACIATCAEVEIDSASRKVRVVRVVQAWESGAIVNPDGLRNQIGGALVQAIGGGLFEAVQFADGRVLNPHFAQYRVPRFADIPKIELVLVNRPDIPSAGAGETGIVGLAPAVSNAIFAATGVRLRNMPMAPGDAVAGVEAAPYQS